YFFDDFEDEKTMTEKGWSHNAGTKSGGVLTLTDGKFSYTSGAAGASTWTDYAVTAKLKTGITAIPSDESKSITSIVARSNNAANGGYEFGILVDKTGAYYQLYKRANPTVGGKINGELNKISKNIDLTATHNMKIIVKGARILCYDGDELIFDITDSYDDGNEYSVGYAGIRAPAGTGVYDDFTVRAITEEEETAIASIAPVVPPDGGEENDENIIFKDDFDSEKAMSESGWNANSTTGEKSGGIFTLDHNRATYVNKIDGSDTWDDYVIEADVRYISSDIDEDVITVVNILARSTKTTSDGYEFGFRCDSNGNTHVRLYKRGVSGGKIGGVEYLIPYTVLPDTFYHAKIVAVGNRIIGYFNNMKVFDVVDEKEPYLTGYPGIRNAVSPKEKPGYTSSYDNFVVRKVLVSDIVDEEKIKRLNGKIWFFDDFDAETSLTERGWNSDTPQFVNGSVSMAETSNSIYLTGVEGSEKWRDYTVKADVVIDKSKGTLGGQTMGATWISARSTRTTSSGYEFGIMSYASGKTNLRLREVAGKKDLMLLDGYEVTDGVHQLKMTCQSNVIRCYFDGKLVMTASDTVNKMGYPGIRASGYIANYDNFTVSDIEADEVLDLPKTDEDTVKSPLTGNLHFVFAAAPFVFAVSFSALAFVLIRFIINRRKIIQIVLIFI
ncbi:MAG: hypothetical protein J6T73_06310, partial [Clostridia bacterium]|nr:hypothetical protein [Clostridia bacterium]